MRRKKFVCKMTAALLSAAMVVAWMPMNGQTEVNAAGVEQAQSEFQFGSSQTELPAGEYPLGVTLMKSTDITSVSMAGSCIKDGKLTVNQDGTADVTINLQAVTVGTVSSWASDWMIYAEGLDGEGEAAEYTQDGEGNVNSITFCLPDNSVDGIYVGMSSNGYPQKAYFAFDFVSLVSPGDGNIAEKKNGSARVEQFGEYDVNVVVSVLRGIITKIEVEGADFGGTYAEVNKAKLQEAADVLQTSFVGKSATDAEGIAGVDAVSGATYSSEAIRTAILNALGLEAADEVINLPTQKLAEGTYQVDIAFYTDGVKHSLIENDKAQATITADAEGNMTLTTAVVNGTEKEPLYFYAFNGYYEGNNAAGELKAAAVKKEDIDFSDEVFGADEKVVTEVSFPLEGDFAEEYRANASIYVPAMKNLTGDMAGITFNQGRFSTDCFAKVYWDSLKRVDAESGKTGFGSQGKELEAGVYTLPVGMKNATDITKDSMAGSCLQGGALNVKADGSATVTLNLTAVSVMGQTAWASDWKIYQEQNTDSALVDAEVTKTDGEGNVTQIVFALPDKSADGVYISMSAMGGRVMQAYLAFDFANAVKQEVSLTDGIYLVEGAMYKPDFVTKSMADTAFNHNIQMTVQNGKATLTMNFKGMEITGLKGYLGSLKYYSAGYQKDTYGNPVGELKDVTVESLQKYSDGVVISDNFGTNYPDVVSFEVIPEALEDGIVPLQVFVPIMESITAGTGNQNVYLKLELGNLKETTADDELFKETEAAPENPAASSGEDKEVNTPAAPSVPSNVKAASAAYNKIKVSWSKVSGANGYEVYQYNSSTKKYSLVAAVAGTSYTKGSLKTGTTYTYKVCAYKTVNGKKVYSSYSKAVSAKPALSKAAGVKAKNSKSRAAVVSWKKVSGASGYVVCRSTKKNSGFKTVTTIKKNGTVKFTNKKLKKGKTYYYKVRAYRTVDGKKVYASYSTTVKVKIKK